MGTVSKRTPRKTDNTRPHRIDPDTLDLAGLGEEPDKVIAARNGVSIGTIFQIRKRKKIPSAREKSRAAAKARVEALAHRYGADTDEAIAKAAGVTEAFVSAMRRAAGVLLPTSPSGIDWDEQPLGKVPDGELAAKLGVSKQRIHQVRKARGIARAS